jgi:hypothetical protein
MAGIYLSVYLEEYGYVWSTEYHWTRCTLVAYTMQGRLLDPTLQHGEQPQSSLIFTNVPEEQCGTAH